MTTQPDAAAWQTQVALPAEIDVRNAEDVRRRVTRAAVRTAVWPAGTWRPTASAPAASQSSSTTAAADSGSSWA